MAASLVAPMAFKLKWPVTSSLMNAITGKVFIKATIG